MNIKENISLAWGNICVNKMRSMLTMLGIIIGISAVITITTIGNSLKQTIGKTMNSFGGTNQISAYISPVYPDDIDWDTWEEPLMTEEETLTSDDLYAFKGAFPDDIDEVVAYNSVADGKISVGDEDVKVELMGSTPGWFSEEKIDILKGRDISDEDIAGARPVAVISDHTVKYAFDGKNPIGQEVSVNLSDGSVVKAYVVGVYHYDRAKLEYDNGKSTSKKNTSTPVLMPITYVEKGVSTGADLGIYHFSVLTKEGVDPSTFTDTIKTYFNENKYNGINASDQFTLDCYDQASELEEVNKILDIVTVAIAVIAAISLVVGGVGVMNIMLVSVVERTREIGIRKAMGAEKKNIHAQFLTEAVMLCFIGGVIGILIGILNGFVLAKVAAEIVSSMEKMQGLLELSVSPSIPAIILSVTFSMLTGIVFGSYPAKRAAALSPIEALRYE